MIGDGALNPPQVAREGEKIYAEKYRQEYEAKFSGQFVAVNIRSGAAFVAQFPEDAIQKAKEADASALLHLIRIGSPSAFQVNFLAPHAGLEWVL